MLLPHYESKNTPTLDHWVFKKHKNKFEEAFVDADAFKQQFS